MAAARGSRRTAILEAAATLFAENGYAATGVDDIGQAAGVTGPAVYRHFDNKNAVLSAVTLRAIERILEGVGRIVDEVSEPTELLGALARNVVTEILADPASWAVVLREQRHLEPASAQVLTRSHRLHVEEWVHALSRVRPELSEAEMRLMVHCVIGLTAAIAGRDRTGLPPERMADLLVELALRALLAR